MDVRLNNETARHWTERNSLNRSTSHGFNVHNSLFARLIQQRWLVGERCNAQNNICGGWDYSLSVPETVRYALSHSFTMSAQGPLRHAWPTREAHPDVSGTLLQRSRNKTRPGAG